MTKNNFTNYLQSFIESRQKANQEINKSTSSLDQLIGQERMLNGKLIVLAEDKVGRLGWVFKDTGLPPTNADMQPKKKKNHGKK
jgi:hypothetical protein